MIILHTYSRKNSGDGLLVDLTVGVGKEAQLGNVTKIVSLDKGSFKEFESIYEPQIINSGILIKIKYILKSFLNIVIPIDLFNKYLPENSNEPVLAVGGGYMRGRTSVEGLKTFLAHVPQLIWAGRQKKCAVVYLPQSIGPFSGVLNSIIKNNLKKIDLIFARDDLTVRDLGLNNIIRVPDLAVQELAMNYKKTDRENSFKKIYLIARAVNAQNEEHYISRLIRLRQMIPNIEPLLQSEGRGNDDINFYKRLGWSGPIRRTKEVLCDKDNIGVVISVRLHGSLQSMISGCPSIHLSYERKGFGAFSDLGISQYCHGFKSFSPTIVFKQAMELQKDSSTYWQSIDQNVDNVLSKRELMIELIKEASIRYSK